MGMGYLIGWKASNASMVSFMVIIIAIGTGFFKGNLSALQGRMYEDKSMLDSAFSIQYSFVNVGLVPNISPVRGVTDGARLSFKGLPCPNLGTGGYAYHGPYEHITVEAMDLVVKITKDILKLYADA